MSSKIKQRKLEGVGGALLVVTGWLRNWPSWIGYAAAGWALIYGALGLYWWLVGEGFPFGARNDPDAPGISVLVGAQPDTAAPVIAVAYAPIVLAGVPFGWPPVNYFEAALPWPVVNQFVCITGGLLLAAAAVAYRRRTAGACAYCGRSDARAGWTAPGAAARWGRWAVRVSFVVPVLYAVTRGAWALGIPLGITDEFLRELQSTGLVWAGAGLAAVAVGGAFLTLGLVRRWGEVFPRWMPFLSGRRVPIPLAVVPAALVSVLVTAAGLMFVRLALFGAFNLGKFTLTLDENWAALLRSFCGRCGEPRSSRRRLPTITAGAARAVAAGGAES
jgi:hypothetical protein